MKKKHRKKHKWTWLGILNFLILQWFFVRLAKEVRFGKVERYHLLTGIVPFTGWWSNYIYVGKVRQAVYRHDADMAFLKSTLHEVVTDYMKLSSRVYVLEQKIKIKENEK